MASFQEGQACTVAGMAHSTVSTTSIHFIATFFMTIFLVLLFYVSEPERQARKKSFRLRLRARWIVRRPHSPAASG